MKGTGLYAGLFQRVWPGLRVGLASYILGVAAYYALGCWTGMNARYGRSLADPSDDLWGAQQCLYAAGITFTTIGYTDLLGTDDVRVYRHPLTGHHYAYNSADGLVPEPGAPPADLGHLVLEHDYSLLTTMGTVVLAVVGMGVFVYAISSVTAFFVEGGHLELQERRRMERQVARLGGHALVCGAGATGLHTVERLLAEGTPLVVVERDRESLARLRSRFPAVLWIEGDPTDHEVLHAAGLGRARGLVTTMRDDNDNLVAIVTARQENPALRIVSRAESREASGRLLRAGAAEVVAPSFMGGMRIASEAIRPTVVRFLDGFLGHETEMRGFRFAGLRVEAGSPHAGKTLGQSRFIEETGLRVLALRYAGRKDFRYNPGPDAMLEAGVEVAVVADGEALERARAFLGAGSGGLMPGPEVQTAPGAKDLFILCGGGATARVVVEELVHTGRRFVVVERDPATCERLREVLPPGAVVEGDATDEAVLSRAGVRSARGLLAMLSGDKLNLVVVVTALQINPALRVVAAGTEESQWDRLRRAGAVVVSTAHIGGRRLATGLTHPEAAGFLNEMLSAPSERPIRIEAVLVTAEGGAAGKTLGEMEVYRRARVQVIALCRGADGAFAYNPADGTRLQAGDRLLCIGDFERVDRLAALVGRWE